SVALFDEGSKRATWQWDGTGWQQVPTTVAPTERAEFGTVADPRRDTLVVVGGVMPIALSGALPDVWELDGDRWTLATSSLQRRAKPAVAFAERRQSVMVFGGRDEGIFVRPMDDISS